MNDGKVRMLGIIALIALVLMLAGCNGPRWREQAEVDTGPVPTAVRVVQPQPANAVALSAPLSGVVKATGQVRVSFQVPGLVKDVLVNEGERVKPEQVLARLDQRLFAAQREQAAGGFAQAEAALTMARNGARPEEIAQAVAQVAAAGARFEQLRADYQRARELFEQGVISRQTLDAAESGYRQAEQALVAAGEQLALARKGPRDEEIAQAEAAVQLARGVLMQAETQLDYATLTAPIAGTVVLRQVEPGMSVCAGTPVFELADITDLEVHTEVPEGDLGKIAVGDTVVTSFPASPEIEASGVVHSIAPNAQFGTRGFPIRVTLVSHGEGVLPGMVAKVSFDYMEPPGGVVIPGRCLLDGAVFVVNGGIARRQPVMVLLDKGERVFVDGLGLDDRVIINGQHLISNGDTVNIVDALAIEEITALSGD